MIRQTGENLGVTTGGTLKDMKATISANKIGKLFELLQAPYSDPIGSIVRETATNAWDAHKEIGQKAPIEVKFAMDAHEGYFVEFIDQGIGMDEERISSVFVNYLESTKEDTDDQAGHFGIGSKAPLSYADEYFLTTVADKTKYEYIIRKDDDGIPMISLLGFEDCDEHTGSTIKIYLKSKYDTELFLRACQKQLHFFDHVVVINRTDVDQDSAQFNNGFTILKGKHFITKLNVFESGKVLRTAKWDENSLVCSIGQVAYPINLQTIKDPTLHTDDVKKFDDKVKLLQEIGVGLRFEIGDNIDVTMTRESIRYNNNINKTIREKIDVAYDEVLLKNLNNRTENGFADFMRTNSLGAYDTISTLIESSNGEIKFTDRMVPQKTNIRYPNSQYFWNFDGESTQGYQIKSMIIEILRKIIRYRTFDQNGVLIPKTDEFLTEFIRHFWSDYESRSNGYTHSRINVTFTDGGRKEVWKSNKYNKINSKWVKLYNSLKARTHSSYQKTGIIVWEFRDIIDELQPKKDMQTLAALVMKAIVGSVLNTTVLEDQVGFQPYYVLKDTLHPSSVVGSIGLLDLNSKPSFDGLIEVNHEAIRKNGITDGQLYNKNKLYLDPVKAILHETTVIAYKQNSPIGVHLLNELFKDEKTDKGGKTAPVLIRVDEKNFKILKAIGVHTANEIYDGINLPPVNRIRRKIHAHMIKKHLPYIHMYFVPGSSNLKSAYSRGTMIKKLKDYHLLAEINKHFNGYPETYLNGTYNPEYTSTVVNKVYDEYLKQYPELLCYVDQYKQLDYQMMLFNKACNTFNTDIVKNITSYDGMRYYNKNIAKHFRCAAIHQNRIDGKHALIKWKKKEQAYLDEYASDTNFNFKK